VVPALRKEREGRGTHCVSNISEIKGWATLPDDARGLDAPDGFDGAMQGLTFGMMWIASGHCYRSHQLQS